MKIAEILQEYNSVMSSIGPKKTPTDSAVKVGEIPVSINKEYIRYSVLKDSNSFSPRTAIYFVVDKNNEVLAYSLIYMDSRLPPNCAQTKQAQCYKPNFGLMSALYRFIIRDENIKLISGGSLTPEGVKYWESLIRRGAVDISIIDKITGKKYSISDVKKGIVDNNVKILEPKDDINLDSNKQRFFFIAESVEDLSFLALSDEEFESLYEGTHSYGGMFYTRMQKKDLYCDWLPAEAAIFGDGWE